MFWAEMSYNRFDKDYSLSQQCDVEDDFYYIRDYGDYYEFNETDLFIQYCD